MVGTGLCADCGFLAAGEPHNKDHEYGKSHDQPGLDVLRQEPGRFWRSCLRMGSFTDMLLTCRRRAG